MSGRVQLDYTSSITWLCVCSLYTTLLTLTTVCVAFFLRKCRAKRFKNSLSLHLRNYKTKRVRQVGIHQVSSVIEQSTTSWKNFPEGYSASKLHHSQSLYDFEEDRCKHLLHIIKPADAKLDKYDFTDDAISIKSDSLDEEYLKTDIEHNQTTESRENLETIENQLNSKYYVKIDKCYPQCLKGDIKHNDLEKNTAIKSEIILDSPTNSLNEELLNANEKNLGKMYLSDNYVEMSAKALCIDVLENSISKATDIANSYETDRIIVDTHFSDSGVVYSFGVKKASREKMEHTSTPNAQIITVKEQEITDVDKLCKLQEIVVTDIIGDKITEIITAESNDACETKPRDIPEQKDFRNNKSLEKLNEETDELKVVAVNLINQCTPTNDIQDLTNKTQDSQLKTIFVEDEIGDKTITQPLDTEILQDSSLVPLEKKTYMSETENRTISLTLIAKENSDNIKNIPGDISTNIFPERLGPETTPKTESNCNITENVIILDTYFLDSGMVFSFAVNRPFIERTEYPSMQIKEQDENISNAQCMTEYTTKSDQNLAKKADSQLKTTLEENISITQSLHTDMIKEGIQKLTEKSDSKLKATLDENESGNISTTKLLHTEMVQGDSQDLTEKTDSKLKEIVFECKTGNMSINQSLQAEMIQDDIQDLTKKADSKLKTTVYEDEAGNISITQSLDTGITQNGEPVPLEKKTYILETDNGTISLTQIIPLSNTNKTNTVLSDDEETKEQVLEEKEENTEISQGSVQNSSNLFKHPAEKDKVNTSIVSKQSNNAMIKFLLAGLTPAQKCESEVERNILADKTLKHSEISNHVTDVSAVLGQTENEPADKNINLDKLLKSTQQNLNQLIGYLSKVNIVQNKKSSLNAIPEDNVLPEKNTADKDNAEKDSADKDNAKPLKSEEKIHCRDLLVYQTATKTYSKKAKTESSNNVNIMDTDYVSVRHGLPQLSSQIDSHYDIQKDNYKFLSDSNVEIVEVGCSDSYSPSNYSPIGEHGEDGMNDNSYSSLVNTDVQTNLKNSSILNSLLYMGERSEFDVSGNNTIKVVPGNDESKFKRDQGKKSDESFFYITRSSSPDLCNEFSEAKEEYFMQNPTISQPLTQRQFHTRKRELNLAPPESYHDSARFKRNRHFEKVVSRSDNDYANHAPNFHKDSGKELLEMLSKFTDKGNQPHTDMTPERLRSSPPKSITGQSPVASRENLSTSLEISRCSTLDTLSTVDDFKAEIIPDLDIVMIPDAEATPQKDCKVIKNLRFQERVVEDDIDAYADYPINDTHVFSNTLTKTFGEPSRPDESYKKKGHVIPSYLKDVSDGIKALMLDLTKPMAADGIPFDARVTRDRAPRRQSSTHSSEVQANLFTSSQIDLQPSCPHTLAPRNIKHGLKSIIKPYYIDDVDYDDRGPQYSSSDNSYYNGHEYQEITELDTRNDSVKYSGTNFVQFDPSNPLNNVCIPPIIVDAHGYSPIYEDTQHSVHALGYSPNYEDIQSSQSEFDYSSPNYKDTNNPESEHKYSPIDKDTQSSENVNEYSRNYKDANSLDNYDNSFYVHNDDDAAAQYVKDTVSDKITYNKENDNKLITIKESGETLHGSRKHEEINTAISMQDNHTLLEASSSLTLVDSSSIHETNKKLDDGGKRYKKRKIFGRKSRKYSLPHIH